MPTWLLPHPRVGLGIGRAVSAVGDPAGRVGRGDPEHLLVKPAGTVSPGLRAAQAFHWSGRTGTAR